MSVSLCSRTKVIVEAADDIRLLNELAKTEAPRDPFVEKKGEGTKSESSISRHLNVAHAVIVGITKKGSTYIALVRGTNNKVYFLKAGDKLHDGMVVNVSSNTVTFRLNKGKRLVKKQLRPFPD